MRGCVHVLLISEAGVTGVTWYGKSSVGLKVQGNFKPQKSVCLGHMVAYMSSYLSLRSEIASNLKPDVQDILYGYHY